MVPANAVYRAQHLAMLASTAVIVRALHLLLDARTKPPGRVAQRALQRRFDELLRDDFENARRGRYPFDLLFGVPFGEYAKRLPEALIELPRFVARGRRKGHDELPADVDRELYPHYYLRNFHWQTDGWFSARSARLYDYEVELLFGGVADVMRRQALPHLKDGTADLAHPRILDLGCGTGRFLKACARALPKARLFGVDLSRPYLDHAGKLLGDACDVSLVRDNAEATPFAPDSFDGVASIFLFHELPKDARARIHAEAFRVVAPGRRYVVMDAAQNGDGDEIMEYLALFPRLYHEPYFLSYLGDPLEDGVARAGFVVEDVRSCFTGKLVVGRKPA
jgi:ubiquinone/menaquinone biosynthesis C-methylase UbiE